MRKIILVSITILVGLFLVNESGVTDSLLIFLLTGSIPGTSIILSPNTMLACVAAVAWLVLVRMTALGAINLFTMRRLMSKQAKKRHAMPERRYSRI